MINWLRHWPRIMAFIAAGALCWIYKKYPETYVDQGELITSLTNIAFVLLTYESLVFARQSISSPHITAKFMGVGNILTYINQYPNEMLETQKLGNLRSSLGQTEGSTQNCIFVEIENVGQAQALNVSMKVHYSKKSLGGHPEGIYWEEIIGNLKQDKQRVVLIETFEGATDADEFQLINCTVEYSDMHKIQTGQKPIQTNPSIDPKNKFDQGVVIKML